MTRWALVRRHYVLTVVGPPSVRVMAYGCYPVIQG